jgi:3-deoxy-manno-octulosonate cytidylyltransferase (CMP-KDO synthetase)
LDPAAIDAAVLGLLDQDDIPMGTLKKRIERVADVQDPNVVKVVTDNAGNAIYFSRSPIPFVREANAAPAYFKHIGLYVYRRAFLLDYAQMQQTVLEETEKLEQLRALEHGYQVKTVVTEYESFGVDIPDDLGKILNRLEES